MDTDVFDRHTEEAIRAELKSIDAVKANVFCRPTMTGQMSSGPEEKMEEKTKYFVLKKKAVPEVLLKVVEAKKLLESERAESVQEATDMVGISRSSFYKYKDDIFPFHDNARGKTITMVMQMDDEPGLLSRVLGIVADFHANILTIHQSIPVNGVASLTLSVDVLPDTGNVSQMVENIEQQEGIHYLKILARE